MTDQRSRALIVDDEGPVRRLLSMALLKEGFACESAENGVEALALATERQFDLLVTDLRMAHGNGHALAVELLARAPRPVIVIHTSVVEPRLAKDLVERGVDDIVFKPVNFGAFAGKLRALVDRRTKETARQTPITDHSTSPPATFVGHVVSPELEEKLRTISEILPISRAALEVYRLTCDGDTDARRLAAANGCVRLRSRGRSPVGNLSVHS